MTGRQSDSENTSRSPPSLCLAAGFALVFFYAPLDADQGFIQKIFYLHVPLAIVALLGFIVGGDLRDPPPAHAATAATTPTPTSRSTSR